MLSYLRSFRLSFSQPVEMLSKIILWEGLFKEAESCEVRNVNTKS